MGSARAQAADEGRAYWGAHPVSSYEWHLEDDIHVHRSLPIGDEGFAELDGALVFVGDPTAFGYSERVYNYRGAHPLWEPLDAICGIEGRHRHHFAPAGGDYSLRDGYATFVGALRGGVPSLVPADRGGSGRPTELESAPRAIDHAADLDHKTEPTRVPGYMVHSYVKPGFVVVPSVACVDRNGCRHPHHRVSRHDFVHRRRLPGHMPWPQSRPSGVNRWPLPDRPVVRPLPPPRPSTPAVVPAARRARARRSPAAP